MIVVLYRTTALIYKTGGVETVKAWVNSKPIYIRAERSRAGNLADALAQARPRTGETVLNSVEVAE